MAYCNRCGKYYDETTVEDEYDNDEQIAEYNLEGSYINVHGYCCECAVRIAIESYIQGIEDLSYRWGED